MSYPNRGWRKASRRGLSLFEMVLVIAVIGMISTVSAKLFHSLMRQQAATSSQMATSMSVTRLRSTFTDDVQAAVDATVTEDIALFRQADDSEIQWQRVANALVRTNHDANGTRNDHFDILPEHTVRFQTREIADNRSIVEIQLILAEQASENNQFVIVNRGSRIVAELSRHYRWKDSEGKAAE